MKQPQDEQQENLKSLHLAPNIVQNKTRTELKENMGSNLVMREKQF